MKQKKWMKFRHRVITAVVRPLIAPVARMKYGVEVQRFLPQRERPYLLLYNHQTGFDQFFIGMACSKPVYYLATEDIFSLGFVSKLLKYAVEPIPIKKQATDVGAVRSCIRVAREGGSIAIAPEGNRTYDGRTVYINPAIVSLVRMMKLPVALFRIEGGYGVQPRWSNVTRPGKMRAYVHSVIEPEEYEQMSQDALYRRICEGLQVEENCLSGLFPSNHSAEYLERALYVCPQCGLTHFESKGTKMKCTRCGRAVQYMPNKEIKGIGWNCPFRFVADWYDYQCDYINRLDTADYLKQPLFEDTADWSEVILYQKKLPLKNGAHLRLYGDRIVLDEGTSQEKSMPFVEISTVTVLGKNKLNIYHGDKVYQFKGDVHFNALKYMNIYHCHRNISKGDPDGKFLGI